MRIIRGIKSLKLKDAPVGTPFIIQDPERDAGEKIAAMAVFDHRTGRKLVISLDTGHSISTLDEDTDISLCPDAVLVLDGQIG